MSPREIADSVRRIQDSAERLAFLDKACAGNAELRRHVEILLSGDAEGETVSIDPADSSEVEFHTWSEIERRFDELRELPPEEQKARLSEIPDVRVREEVASLLAHSGTGAGGTLQGVVGAMAAFVAESGSDRQIGPYELLRPLGEGGMGIVFHARQHHPIRRDVALKIIKPGMDTRQIVTRFESERQALAMMEHPNIARVLDAGATPAGRPYFVMELVNGLPVTTYCDVHKLTTRERLELFVPICQAIQHAHQKGVIHRDIKPSNILVSEQDGKPVPKIIDFGIAKAIGQALTDASQFTNLGTIVGTLEYMSPEQANGDTQDVDTRADIYSLGAVLYELLTGATPLDRENAIAATYLELLRRIREEDPTPPSSRIRSTKTVDTVYASRRTDAGRLPKLLAGELDWIVMKAIEKDRARRYETANGLARDIERYLGGEAVEAGPPSAAYRLKKIATKHRGALAAAVAFLALLTSATIVTAWQAVRASRAEKAATAVNEFLEKDLLSQAGIREQASPNRKADPTITVRTLLDRAAQKLDGQFAAQPNVEASLRLTMGNTYWDLGIYPEARKQFERGLKALGSNALEQRDGLQIARGLGVLDWWQGKYADSEAHLKSVLERERRIYGNRDPLTLETMEALTGAYLGEAKYPQAEQLAKEILQLREQGAGASSHQDTAKMVTLGNLSQAYRLQGKYREAEQTDSQVLEISKAAYGEEHPETLGYMEGLARDYTMEGKYPEAEKLNLRVVELQTRLIGAENPVTLTSKTSLALCYFLQGKFKQAEEINSAVLAVERRVKGPEHPDTLTSMHNLAAALNAQGRSAEAMNLSQVVYEKRVRTLGPESAVTLSTSDLLGAENFLLGNLAKAEQIHSAALQTERRVYGDSNFYTLMTMNRLAMVTQAQSKLEEAEKLQKDSAEGIGKLMGPEHQYAINGFSNLAYIYTLQNRFNEAEQLLRPMVDKLDSKNSDLWLRYRCHALLGRSLAGQRKFEQAELLLLSGYAGLLERKMRISREAQANIVLAARWLAELYQETGKPGQAAQWRSKAAGL